MRHPGFTRLALVVLLMIAMSGGGAVAHTLRPAIVSVTFAKDATFNISIRTNIEAIMAQIGPQHMDTNESPNAQHYNQIRLLLPDQLRSEFVGYSGKFLSQMDARFNGVRVPLSFVSLAVEPVGDVALARKSVIHLSGTIPAHATQFTWHYPSAYGSNVLKLGTVGEDAVRSVWLKRGEVNEPFALAVEFIPPSRSEVAVDYGVLGFTHILPLGLDHILFVLGIFLLSLKLRPILCQVTAFTLAHTLTLGLTIYGWVSLPSTIVEPLIAISIVYIGVENILVGRLRPWRVVIVFLFGLLHGMGFAGVLSEIGLPQSEFMTALITFNVGVELGQLAVITLALLLVGWFRQAPWYRFRVVIPLSAMISLVGLYWTVERLM